MKKLSIGIVIGLCLFVVVAAVQNFQNTRQFDTRGGILSLTNGVFGTNISSSESLSIWQTNFAGWPIFYSESTNTTGTVFSQEIGSGNAGTPAQLIYLDDGTTAQQVTRIRSGGGLTTAMVLSGVNLGVVGTVTGAVATLPEHLVTLAQLNIFTNTAQNTFIAIRGGGGETNSFTNSSFYGIQTNRGMDVIDDLGNPLRVSGIAGTITIPHKFAASGVASFSSGIETLGVTNTGPFKNVGPFTNSGPFTNTGAAYFNSTVRISTLGTGRFVLSDGASQLGTSGNSLTLRDTLTDETGTGSAVFNDAPTFTGTTIFSGVSTSGTNTFGGWKFYTNAGTGTWVQTNTITGKSLTFDTNGNFTITGTNTAGYFVGNGSNLTGVETFAFAATNDATVANTITETSLISNGVGSLTLPANFLTVGSVITLKAKGYISYDDGIANPNMTNRIKFGSTTLHTYNVGIAGSASNFSFKTDITITCRSVGVTGTVSISTEPMFSNYHFDAVKTGTVTVDTTTANTIDFTQQWNEANAVNTLTIQHLSTTARRP